MVNGVRYIHSRWSNEKTPRNEREHLEASVQQFMILFSVYRPAAVLAASNWIVGLPAWVAAKRLGLPFYNEVRGFWELSRAAREPLFDNSKAFELEAERDTFIAKQSLTTFTLNVPMQEELVKRGVQRQNIKIVPNGVSDLPTIKPADPRLQLQLGIEAGDKVIGYIGSHTAYEGLDTLVEACELLVKQGHKIKLLLIGDQQPLTKVEKIDNLLGIHPWLIQTGRVPHEKVADYYALIDLVVIPRKKLPVCELVPPMKAAEALAYGKRLVVSDVAPLKEYSDKHKCVVTFEAGRAESLKKSVLEGLEGVEPKVLVPLLLNFNTQPIIRVLSRNSYDSVENSSPLKTYTNQPGLSVHKAVDFESVNDQSKDLLIDAGDHFEITVPVKSNEEYTLSLKCLVEKANPKGCVADITFFNKNGRVLPEPYPGMSNSNAFGAYFYVETQEPKRAKIKSYNFMTPRDADKVSIKLVAFDVKQNMTLVGDYKLKSLKDSIKESTECSEYIDSFNQILNEAKQIPDSNGSEYFTKHDFCVGVIGDVYMYNFYKDVFTSVHYLSPDNYQKVLEKDLDILIYTTCWKGISNEEWRGVKFRDAPKKALSEILAYAEKHNIKTVFQTIEDPSNFDYFLPVAEKFEYIFTTDTDCIERYKEELGHNRVFFGEYGVNPQFNNPIGCRRDIRNAAFFAGSYPKRYKERCEDMETIFDSIVDSNGELLIADRNFGANSEDLVYPERFQSSVLPPVQHSILQKLHKLFRYNLNFNSIKQSPTMCAMRVYELQAQGNGFISNYASSVFNKFPGIRIIPYKQDMSFDFEDDETWEEYRANISNIREVLNSKTSYQVVSTLLKNIGLKSTVKKDITILVICKKKTDKIESSFEAQAYCHKLLIEESELKDWDNIKREHNVGYFCWFSEDNVYEKYYLNDLLNGFKYTNSSYVTKNSYFNNKGAFVAGKAHEYTSKCSSKSLSLFSAQKLDPAQLSIQSEELSFYLENGYSIDPFEVNFVQYMNRNIHPKSNHKLSVIVPVYNNGRFLKNKCIPSIQRNKLFSQMEVLLIDDGSTCLETLNTLEYLEKIYPNVRVRFNKDGGSGSASRPRNQGIEMAASPLVTFLDPDNEISPGSYDRLVGLYNDANRCSEQPVQFVSGFHVKVAEDVKIIGKHTNKELSIIRDFEKGYFDKGRFPVVATQSAVISKKMFEDGELRFIEKSAGQDTLFGWALIAKSNVGAFTSTSYIIYYADRSDSITNEVNISYFKKKRILEKEQKKFLLRNNLLEKYIDCHFDNFMKNWYLKKLERVNDSQFEDCRLILEDICNLYGKKLNDYIGEQENEKT